MNSSDLRCANVCTQDKDALTSFQSAGYDKKRAQDVLARSQQYWPILSQATDELRMLKGLCRFARLPVYFRYLPMQLDADFRNLTGWKQNTSMFVTEKLNQQSVHCIARNFTLPWSIAKRNI